MSIANDSYGFDDGLWLFAILALMGFGGNGMFGNGNRVGESYATQADIQRAVIMRVLYAMQASTIRVYAMKRYMQRSEAQLLTRSLRKKSQSSRLLPQR